MLTKLRYLLLILLFLIIFPLAKTANAQSLECNFYASPTGSGSGLTYASPTNVPGAQTLAQGATGAFVDRVVCLEAGTYQITNNWTSSDQWETWVPFSGQGTVTFNANSFGSIGIHGSNMNFYGITWTGLDGSNTAGAGGCGGGANCAIYLGGTNINFEWNTFSGTNHIGIYAGNGSAWSSSVFKYNTITGTAPGNITIGSDFATGIILGGGSSSDTLNYNYCNNNDGGCLAISTNGSTSNNVSMTCNETKDDLLTCGDCGDLYFYDAVESGATTGVTITDNVLQGGGRNATVGIYLDNEANNVTVERNIQVPDSGGPGCSSGTSPSYGYCTPEYDYLVHGGDNDVILDNVSQLITWPSVSDHFGQASVGTFLGFYQACSGCTSMTGNTFEDNVIDDVGGLPSQTLFLTGSPPNNPTVTNNDYYPTTPTSWGFTDTAPLNLNPSFSGFFQLGNSTLKTDLSWPSVVPNCTGGSGPANTGPIPYGITVNAITVANSSSMTGVLNIGLNLGENAQTWYGDGDWLQNMLDNPGFEQGHESWWWTINSGATSSGFATTHDNGEATNFWNGANGSVRYSSGGFAGDNFVVTGFTSGGTFTIGSCTNSTGGSIACPALVAGDLVTAEVIGPNVVFGVLGNGGSNGNWRAGDANTTVSTTDPFEGTSSLVVDVSGGSAHSFNFPFDTLTTTGGTCSGDHITTCTVANQSTDCSGLGGTCQVAPQIPLHPVVGNFMMSCEAAGVTTSTGTPTLKLALVRSGGTNVNHTFTMTNDGAYHNYAFAFTGGDVATSTGNLTFTVTANNGSSETNAKIYVDDCYLGRSSGASSTIPETSVTGFRDEVVTALNAIKPGSLRYMTEYMLDEDDTNFEGPSGCAAGALTPGSGNCDFMRGSAGQFTGSSVSTALGDWAYSSSDMVALAHAVGANPWVSIPNSFTDADLRALADNACAAIAADGFTVFRIEQGNEDWTGGSGIVFVNATFGSNLTYYGAVAGRNFSIISTEATAHCSSNASKIHYVLGGQWKSTGVATKAINAASSAGFAIPNTSQYEIDNATYNSGANSTYLGAPACDSGGSNSLTAETGSLATQAAAYAAYFLAPVINYFPGCFSSAQAAIGTSNKLVIYESGLNDSSGPGTTEQGYMAEGGFPSAMEQALSWMLGIQALVPVQENFEMSQLTQNAGIEVPLWGTVHDLDSDYGPTAPHFRPVALAQELVDTAIGGGDYYAVTTTGAAGIYANAFKLGTNWSAVLINTNSIASSVQVVFPATGSVPTLAETVLNTNGLTDNNENSNSVTIGCVAGSLPTCFGSVSTTGQSVTVNLPAYSVVALPYTTGSPSGPAFGPAPSGGHGMW